MIGFSSTNLDPNTVLYTPLSRLQLNFISSGPISRPQVRIPHLIKWTMPLAPYIKLNTDCSAISNPGVVEAGGILCNHLGEWVSGFSLHLGLASNNMVELAAI